MACSSGNSSGWTQLTNSGSEEDLQVLMNERKRKRMQSNRESARRSRMRKQQHLDELMAQAAALKKENAQILSKISSTARDFMNVEAENSVLRAQMMELSQRLQSLNDILSRMNSSSSSPAGTHGFFDVYDDIPTGNHQTLINTTNSPWMFMMNQQPIMASADNFFQY
ncbi:PREDICTED: bZIP transcription factor 44-like [Ipomoea nil]|uniref:bZIP transcription factor 44-like n=1 Tax=Ipomoea nil TaxID=35883 RepID=UPI0009013666|nr:PREDICTED: bZIP transcription factor 44-like [Ipomoea nil]